MGKFLLNSDYAKIILEALILPHSDYYKYYSNVASDHFSKNEDLFEKLIQHIKNYINWYDYVYNHPEDPNNQKYASVDDSGDIEVSIKHDGMTVTVNHDFFKHHLFNIEKVRKRFQDLKSNRSNRRSKKEISFLTLKDIWETDKTGTKKEYDKQFEKLKVVIIKIDAALLIEENEIWKWNRKIEGSIQYLAGWLHICYKRGWLREPYSSPELTVIVNNTFNADIASSTPFKSIKVKPPKNAKYTELFCKMPLNIK